MTIYTPLDDTLADLANIRIKRNSKTNETALIGVDFNMLRHLIVTARLYEYDHPHQPKVIDPNSKLVEVEKANAQDDWVFHHSVVDVLEHIEWLLDRSVRPDYTPTVAPVAWKRKSRKRTPSPAYLMKGDNPTKFKRFAWLPVRIRRMLIRPAEFDAQPVRSYDVGTRWVWLREVTFTKLEDNKTLVAWEHDNE